MRRTATGEQPAGREVWLPVKDLLDENSPYRDLIDDGIALAVTQAAIWTYGNRNGEKLGGNDFNKNGHTDRFLEYYYPQKNIVSQLDDAKWNAAKALYDALIRLKPSDAGTVTDIITKEDIKNATIRVSRQDREQIQDGPLLYAVCEARNGAMEKTATMMSY